MPPGPIRAVLFDLDNTLADRDRAFLAWAQWFMRERLGLVGAVAIDAALAELVGLDNDGHASKDAMFRALKDRHAALTEPIEDLVAAFREQLLAHLPPLDSSTAGLLTGLDDAGIPWGIVTNGSRSQMHKIRTLGLEHRAACVVISEAVGIRKPDPTIFRLAAERIGVSPRAVLFVGDDPDADIGGAGRMGMRTAWLSRGQEWPARLPSTSPDFFINSLADLRQVLGI